MLTLAASVLLGTLYFTPLWSVRLVAPQYPEGIGMLIRLNTIEGMKEHDLNNINSLNHYIGMKAIEPDAIPELQYMPWIVAALIASGVAVAALGRRRLLLAWTAGFALFALAGLADFYRWGYDYGHNLDPDAIIVVPGMSYQPPVLGTKQLLNFHATSLPAIGGIFAGVAFLAAVAALFLSYRRRGLGAAGAAMVAACATGTPAIALGTATCAECRMLITDGRFGAVAVTSTGKQIEFDSVDCLIDYLREHPTTDARAIWVADAAAPGALIHAERASFVREGALRPPMGTLVSYDSASAPAGGITWSALQSESPVGADAP
ncbi:MAG TPA: nitrous oxide reductase accessory protein NosL [Gemmatimonadaceae bacterium]|nr:nitrous oxide reductase accessory protein NosL [Gemmatimonadaceae bacterium]